MAVQFIFIAAIAIHLAINGNKEAKFFTVIFSVFLILSVLDIVLFNVSNQYYSLQMWKWGVLISAVGLLIVLGKRFVHVHDNIMSNAKVLENKNHELDMMWRSLLVSEEHLRQITENTIDLISESDLEGVFQYVTPSHYRVLGYTDEELVGRSIIDFLDPVYQEDVRNMIANLKSDLAESRVQVRFRHAEGDYRWLEIIGKLMHGTEGEPKGIIYSSRDITQRVKAEKSLRESEEKYRWLVDVLPDALYMRNKDTVLFANRAAAQQLGAKDPEELMGKKITDVFYPNPYCSSIFSEQMQLLQEMQSIPFAEEQLIRKRDGKIIDVEVAANIFQYSNDTVVLFVLRDMAERRRSEELSLRIEEKSRMLDEVVKYEKLKTDFFSNISHELRTPLNVILGSVQMMSLILKEPQEKPCIKLGKYVHVTRQNCYRLIRLINNLIDITKMDAGFFKLNRVNANIIHIVEEITLSVSEYIESRGLELIFDTEEEEVIIACDPDKIERIMLNLLSNSIKFTEKGGRISVMIKKSDDYVSISIEDTGIGIPADKQDLIFERFRQVDWSFTRSNEGSGIGLSLIKSLVEMHGGRILLKSEHGRGSEFTVQLPIQVVEQEGEEDEPHVHTKNIERIQIEFSDIYF